MDSSIWTRIIEAIKFVFKEKFSAAFKGMCFGLIGSLNIFWSGQVLGPVVGYGVKVVGTVILTALTTFTSAYVSYRFDKWKENQKKSPNQSRKRNAA